MSDQENISFENIEEDFNVDDDDDDGEIITPSKVRNNFHFQITSKFMRSKKRFWKISKMPG